MLSVPMAIVSPRFSISFTGGKPTPNTPFALGHITTPLLAEWSKSISDFFEFVKWTYKSGFNACIVLSISVLPVFFNDSLTDSSDSAA